MKRTLTNAITIFIITLFALNSAQATIVTIQSVGTTAATEAFIPNVANAVCGDTIRWVNVSGTHTTASTTIPAGAATWSSPNLTPNGFIYVVTMAGTYNYTCHPLNGGHMNASIVVTCASGLPDAINSLSSAIYPNPTNGKIRIEMQGITNGTLRIINITGETVYQSRLVSEISEATLRLNNGVYFYEVREENLLLRKGELIFLNN